MTYRELATVNQIIVDELSPESIEAIKNGGYIPKLNNWLDPWRERNLTKKIKKFLIETRDYQSSAFRVKKYDTKINVLWHCLSKFYNAGWDISIDYYKTFKNVYNSDDTESADYWFFSKLRSISYIRYQI